MTAGPARAGAAAKPARTLETAHFRLHYVLRGVNRVKLVPEDADFAVRLAFAGGHFVGCKERLYLQHATQAPDKSAARNFDAEMRLLDKHRAYLEEQDRYTFARNWFTVRFHHFNRDHGRMALALLRGWLGHPVLVTRQLLTTVPARFLHERRASRVGR